MLSGLGRIHYVGVSGDELKAVGDIKLDTSAGEAETCMSEEGMMMEEEGEGNCGICKAGRHYGG